MAGFLAARLQRISPLTLAILGSAALAAVHALPGCGGGSSTTDTGGSAGATSSSSGHGGSSTGGSGGGGGAVDPTCNGDVGSPLPKVDRALEGVRAVVRGKGVSVTFEPIAGARDYRIYELPAAADVVSAGGETHVTNAVYRCAGDREAPYIELDGQGPQGWVKSATQGDVLGFSRDASTITLGHVYAVEGSGRKPVYALGSPAPDADGQCYEERWGATRLTEYVVDPARRAALLAMGFRDDGVAFHVPESGAPTTVHTWEESTDGPRLYFSDAAELAARAGATPAFSVLDAPAEGTVPLQRVFYDVGCGTSHDVLAAGQGRFERVLTQGNQPVWELQWPSLSAGAVLVIEALDAGCPFQGHLSPTARPALGGAQPFVTIEGVRAGAPHGEVFINGQHDPASAPRAIARSYLCVEPGAAESGWDYLATFDGELGPITEVDKNTYGGWDLYLSSAELDISFHSIEPDAWAIGAVRGELWAAYADWASDTNGKVRITPKKKAEIAAGDYLHASMEVDLWATGRRYPQLWVSSHPAPVQDTMLQGTTLNLQTFGGWPTALELQLCDHQKWDVNAQCPSFAYEKEPFDDDPWPPQPTVGEHAAVGRKGRLDLYVSTTRAYVFLDGAPYGCAALPAGAFSAGEVSVTYGDVLYHSGVDEPVVGSDYYVFHRDHMLTETRRHFDNLGFRSHVPAPSWDESRFPCTAELSP